MTDFETHPIGTGKELARLRVEAVRFLDREQLREMTGYQNHSRQIRWLAENGYEFDVRADGRPNVLWQQVRERQCKASKTSDSKPVLNLAALDKVG